jgi:glutamate synthase (NADPH/NADH) small chain
MADPKGFLKYTRAVPGYRPVEVRTLDFCDVTDEQSFTVEATHDQAARCMGCGVPFCHDACPLGNLIPAFNDAVQRENWQQAYRLLQETNYFPEFTGRICPAPCEHACVLGINQPAVAIEHIERSISDIAFEKGYVQAQPPSFRTGKKVAIVGAGPAGLAAAVRLNRSGHNVTVFEKDAFPGGLLRYGIPDFKLEKWIVERRIAILEAEGIQFQCNTNVGIDITGEELNAQFDALLLCVGAAHARNLQIPGASLSGVYPAMDYLTQSNRRVAGNLIPKESIIHARGKHVVVIGGGDTGSDCVGTANRQGALSVSQLQYRNRPPEIRPPETPWPLMPMILQTSSSHEEGCERMFEVQTKAFIAHENGQVKGLLISDLAWERDPATGKYQFQEIPGSEREIPCDLALIAIGYNGVSPNPLWEQLGIQMNEKSCIPDLGNFHTQQEKVFVAGDARRGQSLVVWAIAEGRDAGIAIDQYLRTKKEI